MTLNQLKSVEQGDSCNTYWFGLANHYGTHVDAPAHFFEGGLNINEYPAETWNFEHPCVITLKLTDNELIGIESIAPDISENADIVIFQTGFKQHRGGKKYSCYNPGVKPEVGFWLRSEYPSVRAIGFDFVSLSSFQNRDVGREAHKAFLDPNGDGGPVLIIEDMDLPSDLSELESLWVVPLRVEGIDSAPCTVIGTFQ